MKKIQEFYKFNLFQKKLINFTLKHSFCFYIWLIHLKTAKITELLSLYIKNIMAQAHKARYLLKQILYDIITNMPI